MAVKALFALYPLLQGDYKAVEKALLALEGSGLDYRVFPTHSEVSGKEEGGISGPSRKPFWRRRRRGAWSCGPSSPTPVRRGTPSASPIASCAFPRSEIAQKVLEGLEARSVLDIGTGTGVFAEAFARLGLFTVGVDPRADRLEVARNRVKGARFVEARAESLPFPDGSFDLAFFGLSLHHLEALHGSEGGGPGGPAGGRLGVAP
jgi:SAM-dependent methyltransferase